MNKTKTQEKYRCIVSSIHPLFCIKDERRELCINCKINEALQEQAEELLELYREEIKITHREDLIYWRRRINSELQAQKIKFLNLVFDWFRDEIGYKPFLDRFEALNNSENQSLQNVRRDVKDISHEGSIPSVYEDKTPKSSKTGDDDKDQSYPVPLQSSAELGLVKEDRGSNICKCGHYWSEHHRKKEGNKLLDIERCYRGSYATDKAKCSCKKFQPSEVKK